MIHVNGGAKSHIFRDKSHFWKYVPSNSSVQVVPGQKVPVEDTGIVLTKLQQYDTTLIFYPCSHMPGNPQDTFGLPALKYYGEYD